MLQNVLRGNDNMVKKKTFVKKRVWEISKPNWLAFFSALTLIFFAYYLFGVLYGHPVARVIISGIVILIEYLLWGKYPYRFKTYYKEI